MLRLLESLSHFNWAIFLEATFGTLRRARWQQAYDRQGVAGVALETMRSFAGTNTFMFAVPIDSRWDGYSISRLLAHYGIEIWGWGFYSHKFFFHVRHEDAWDARHIMLQSGVELVG